MAENKEFTPIETQEAFDSAIKERIERAQNTIRKEYEGFEDYKAKAEKYDADLADYQTKLSEKESAIKELADKVAKYESDSVKNRLVTEFGLKAGMEKFLSGSSEEEWRTSAQELADLTKIPDFKKGHEEGSQEPDMARQLLKDLGL